MEYFIVYPFTAHPGVTNTSLQTPLDFFNAFFSAEIKELIYVETTRFAEQEIHAGKDYLDEHRYARGNDWRRKPMTRDEVDPLLAILGIHL